MKLAIAGIEVELKPLAFRDWVDCEKQGLDIQRFQRQRKCSACEGISAVEDPPCNVCKGSGRVMNVSLSDMWTLISALLRKSGLAEDVLNTLSLEDVMNIFKDETLVNFILRSPASPARNT